MSTRNCLKSAALIPFRARILSRISATRFPFFPRHGPNNWDISTEEIERRRIGQCDLSSSSAESLGRRVVQPLHIFLVLIVESFSFEVLQYFVISSIIWMRAFNIVLITYLFHIPKLFPIARMSRQFDMSIIT
jgi:hypothetical protein